jgi:hypothetical protein
MQAEQPRGTSEAAIVVERTPRLITPLVSHHDTSLRSTLSRHGGDPHGVSRASGVGRRRERKTVAEDGTSEVTKPMNHSAVSKRCPQSLSPIHT